MKNEKKLFEIMSPAGSWDTLNAAIQGGADSVYFGIEQLNMRARAANNFKITELPEIVRHCSESGVKTYLTLNTILYDHDIPLMKRICDEAKKAGVTAVIACDLAGIQYAHSINLEVHISTQQNISNIEQVKFFASYADVVVLARELTIKQIQYICDQVKKQDIRGPKGELVEIEIFVHGALCVAISGKCHMSLHTQNASANRGACVQNCRRAYKVVDEETGEELVLDNQYVMSPKDLCTVMFLDEILKTGVRVLKIEGRGKAPDYVYTVTKVYKEAAQSVLEKTFTKEKIATWMTELGTVYNRGFWEGGYYLGKKLGEWSASSGSKATKEKICIGKSTNFFVKSNIAEFILESGELHVGEEVWVTGPTTGILQMTLKELYVDGIQKDQAVKGDLVTFAVEKRVRRADKLFRVVNK
jgi:putative protease